jgi:hypothetical protein
MNRVPCLRPMPRRRRTSAGEQKRNKPRPTGPHWTNQTHRYRAQNAPARAQQHDSELWSPVRDEEAAGSNPVTPTSIPAVQRPPPELVRAAVTLAASTAARYGQYNNIQATNPNIDLLIEGAPPACAALHWSTSSWRSHRWDLIHAAEQWLAVSGFATQGCPPFARSQEALWLVGLRSSFHTTRLSPGSGAQVVQTPGPGRDARSHGRRPSPQISVHAPPE